MTNPVNAPVDKLSSTVKLRLIDPLGAAIVGLKYQIKEGQKIVAKGVTAAGGEMAAFASSIGTLLTVHVERFGTEEMKHIKTVVPWSEDFRMKLVSEKVKKKVNLDKDQGPPGQYRRKTYEVKPGDTLTKIGVKVGATATEIAQMNGIKVTDIIYPHQILKVPAEKSAGNAPGGTAAPAPSQPSQPAPGSAPPTTPAAHPQQPASQPAHAPEPTTPPHAPPAHAPQPTGPQASPQPAAPVPAAPPTNGGGATPAAPSANQGSEPQPAKIIPINTPVPTTTKEERGENGTPKTTVALSCDQSACIKLGVKNALVEEINIRLAGFGGTILAGHDWDEFTTKTEAAVKKFQKDFMKVTPTGRVCGAVLRAIDDLTARYPVDPSSMRCPCGQCSGFGNGFTSSADVNFPKPNVGNVQGKEYPGIHRAVIAWLRAARFYIEEVEGHLGYSFLRVDSGYRCWYDNKRYNPPAKKRRWTFNHMGDALDIHFKKGAVPTRVQNPHIDKIRDEILVKHGIARMKWGPQGSNGFCMEPSEFDNGDPGATKWVHIDVRTFGPKYRLNRFYVTTEGAAAGATMVALAKSNSLLPLLNCGGISPSGPGSAPSASKAETKSSAPPALPKPAPGPAPAPAPALPPPAAGAGGRQPIATLTPSKKCIDFIKGFEKCELKPYNDDKNKDKSKNYCTIGWGHLINGLKNCETLASENDSEYNKFKKGITAEQADAMFLEDLTETLIIVAKCIHAPLYQHEYDALVSLAFNAGGKFKKFKKLISNANSGLYSACCAEFADITSKGKPGLVLRRQREMDIFNHAVYNSKH